MTRTAVAADALPPRPLRVIELEQTVADLMGYVTLWNDVRPVVDAARAFLNRSGHPQTPERAALRDALAKYEALYPEHVQ